MPLIVYSRCCGCEPKVLKKLYRAGGDAPKTLACELCGVEAKRLLSAPSSEAKVFIDNGSMARRVEVNTEIVRINKERAAKNFSEDE
jgi:hypothetical protein